MTLDAEKNRLLEEFREYLERSRLEQAEALETVDLTTLLSEMAALKTEVKTESRHFKSSLDSLNSALESVQTDNKSLSIELAKQDDQLRQQRQEITRNLLLEFVDLYERLEDSLAVLGAYRPVKSLFKRSRDKDIHFIESLRSGQEITFGRLEHLLLKYQVKPIECVGKKLDPVTMNAIQTEYDPQFDNGIVLEELRKGFLFQGQVLRPAEVKVNKIHTL